VPPKPPSRIREALGGRQTQSDPEGGIPSGSLEVLGRLEGLVGKKNLGQRALVSPSKEITQTSDGLLLLQSIAW
jgi:hypothetical protein